MFDEVNTFLSYGSGVYANLNGNNLARNLISNGIY